MRLITTTISKGIIKKIPGPGENIFVVRIPLFEDNTGAEMVFEATACVDPCFAGGFKVGDVVFVTFENSMPESAIILGKLYQSTLEASDDGTVVLNDVQEGGTNIIVDGLIVRGRLDVPMMQDISLRDDQINKLLKKVAELEKRVTELENP